MPLLALVVAAVGYYRAASAAPAARYAEAEAAVAAGRYEDALDDYAAAGDYRDAVARRAALVSELATHEIAYRDGLAALDAGRPAEAHALLAPVVRALPGYKDAAALLTVARERREVDLHREADAAEARHDWLAAERALSALAAADPDDEPLATRLADLRRAHAPVVFARDGALYLAGPDGAEERLIRDGALYLAGPDGAEERLITDAVPVARPFWSPDRTRIAFVSLDEPTQFANATLYVVNPDGTALRPVAERLHPAAVPGWSPDGTRIAYTSAARWDLRTEDGLLTVRVVDVATGRETDLTGGTGHHAMTPTWSPTGDRLAFVARPVVADPDVRALSGRGRVHVVTLASGAIGNLSGDRLPDVSRVWWSPTDDRLLAWISLRAVTAAGSPYRSGSTGIYLLDARSGAAVPIVSAAPDPDISPPVWAPDGSRFAFVEEERTVRVQGIDGTETRIELDSSVDGQSLTWSPDGRTLLVPAPLPGQDSVFIPLNGGSTAPIPVAFDFDTAPPTAGPPQWSPPNPAPPPAPPSVAGTALDPGEAPGD